MSCCNFKLAHGLDIRAQFFQDFQAKHSGSCSNTSKFALLVRCFKFTSRCQLKRHHLPDLNRALIIDLYWSNVEVCGKIVIELG